MTNARHTASESFAARRAAASRACFADSSALSGMFSFTGEARYYSESYYAYAYAYRAEPNRRRRR